MSLQDVVYAMEDGSRQVIKGRGGWQLVVTKGKGADGTDFRIEHSSSDFRFKFFAVDTAGDANGQPWVIQEPSLGIPCRGHGVDVDGCIIGAIVLGRDGQPTLRASWSKLVFIQGKTVTVTLEGELWIDGASHGYLQAVFCADKNRIRGYVGVFGPVKPASVKVLEMETLVLASL